MLESTEGRSLDLMQQIGGDRCMTALLRSGSFLRNYNQQSKSNRFDLPFICTHNMLLHNVLFWNGRRHLSFRETNEATDALGGSRSFSRFGFSSMGIQLSMREHQTYVAFSICFYDHNPLEKALASTDSEGQRRGRDHSTR